MKENNNEFLIELKPEINGIDLDMDIGIDENNSLISEDKKKRKREFS